MLLEAVHSKDTDVIYEALVAIQKIRDESAGPAIAFRLRDLDTKVQIAAIQTTGVLRNINGCGARPRRRAQPLQGSEGENAEALTAIAMLPVPTSRSIYEVNLHDKDDRMRARCRRGIRSPEESCRYADDRESLAGGNEDRAAALTGLRAGDAG